MYKDGKSHGIMSKCQKEKGRHNDDENGFSNIT